MVAHTLEQLTGAGVPTEHIKYEHFYYAAAEQGTDAALTTSGGIK